MSDRECGEPYRIGARDGSAGEYVVLVARCQRIIHHDGKHCAPYLGNYMFWSYGLAPSPTEPRP